MSERLGPEQRSLLVTRSWLILTVVSISWLLTALVTGTRWSQMSGYEQLCIGLAFVCFAIAVAGARHRRLLWLTVVGMLLLAATAIVPSGTVVWTYPQTFLGYVGFILTLLLPRVPGLITAISVPFVAWAVVQLVPANVVLEGFVVANGSVQVLRMLTAQLVLWWAWHRLRAMAASVDAEREQLTQVMLDAVTERERAAEWRGAATRVHATMLNSINAVLEAGLIDRMRLRVLADQGRAALATRRSEHPPLPQANTPRLPVNAGVVLLSSALAGGLIGGSLYAAFIPYPSPIAGLATLACSLAGIVTAVSLVIRWWRLDWRPATLLVLIPAAVPWLLSTWSHPCGDIGPVTATASLAGFAIVCIGLWSGPVPFVLGLLLWALGAIRISQASPVECAIGPTVIVLNVVTFLPVVAVVMLAGARRHRRAIEAMEELTVQAEFERRRMDAQDLVDNELSHSVTRAADILDHVGDVGEMTPAQRRELQCLAARMRIAVMVDLVSAQGFTRSAYDLVVRLADRGIPVEIGVVSDSGDPRPIPAAILDAVVDATTAMTAEPVRVQAVGSEGWDFLSVGLRAGGRSGPMPADPVVQTVDGTSLTISPADDLADGGDLTVLTVERVSGR